MASQSGRAGVKGNSGSGMRMARQRGSGNVSISGISVGSGNTITNSANNRNSNRLTDNSAHSGQWERSWRRQQWRWHDDDDDRHWT